MVARKAVMVPSRLAAISSSQVCSRDWLAETRCSLPVFNPFDWSSKLFGGKGNQKVFRIELTSDTEPATHVTFYEVDTVLSHLQQVR